jgi:hypothetical protein
MKRNIPKDTKKKCSIITCKKLCNNKVPCCGSNICKKCIATIALAQNKENNQVDISCPSCKNILFDADDVETDIHNYCKIFQRYNPNKIITNEDKIHYLKNSLINQYN